MSEYGPAGHGYFDSPHGECDDRLTAERQARQAAEAELERRTRDYQARLHRRDRIADGLTQRLATVAQERDAAYALLAEILTIEGLTDSMECDCWESAPCALHQFEIAAAHVRAVLASAEQPDTSSSQEGTDDPLG